MINFCVEPKHPCCKNPIGELDFKIDKCYSSIYSRLCCHENDQVSHISQKERDEWNGKASNSALQDLQDQLNEIAGDGDNSIKNEILIEVSRQIAGAITGLNIEQYAKKKYVDDAISNIDFDQYVTKNNADSTYLNKADYIRFDPTNYYTIAQIQKIIADSTIGKDYPIQSFTLEHNELVLTQKNGGQFRVDLSGNGSGGGLDTDYVQQQLLNYIKKNTLSKLIINDRTYSIESGRDIRIPTSGAGSNIDLNKFGYNKSYFKEQPSNSAAPSKPSANQPPQDGSGWMETTPNYRPRYYIWMTQVFINGNGQYGEYTNPICLTGTAGENAVSYDIKTSTSTINYQDGTMYPDLIGVYVAKSDGSQITNITPSNSSNWSFSYSINGGNTWTTISSDQIQTEGDNGMLFKATNGTITLNEYVPIIRSGINGLNGITYSLQLSNISLSYSPADQDYNLQMSCNVNLYKNETNINDTEANLYMQLNSNSRTSLQYDSDHWTVTVNTTVQSKSSTITIYAENKNGAHLTSMTIPVSSSGDKGDPGDGSIGQTFKGSPLRIVGSWVSGKKYYDGKRDAENGIFYQDVVLYENMYYVCVNTDSGESDHWVMTPDVATYFQKFAVTENFVTDKIIANQAYIKELSSEEVVIMDGDAIVAGMTSSKAIDNKSDLNGKVNNKGDVRIWAGEISNADLTTAPFTVTSTGVLTCQNQNGNSIALRDGTIWFNINGIEYHLGITNGKPDWINGKGADSIETWYRKTETSTNVTFLSVDPFSVKGNIYFIDGAMNSTVSGTYYKRVANKDYLYYIGSQLFLLYNDPLGIETYIKATFNNGLKTIDGIVAISGFASVHSIGADNNPGNIIVNTDRKQWCSIQKEDKNNLHNMYYTQGLDSGKPKYVNYYTVDMNNVTYGSGTDDGIYILNEASSESVSSIRKISTCIGTLHGDGKLHPEISTISL